MAKRWVQRPDGSTWGDWGDDDELGRINLLTPEKVLEGVREVEHGISFCLSLPLDYPGGTALNQRRYPPVARFPEGDESPKPTPPEVWECDDPRWPAIPAQDFSNLPRQQKGLHAKGFEYMRLSSGLEGHISNFQRTVDGFLAGLPYEQLLRALAAVNVYPFEQPMLDLGF